MFKKLKDKLAEEVKSSPQRLQSFALAAQAAVTSASSSISDISNHDLFTINDDGADTPKKTASDSLNSLPSVGFQDISLSQSPSPFHLVSQNESQETKDKIAPLLNNHYSNNTKIGNENIMDQASSAANIGVYPTPNSNRVRKLSNSSNASDVSFRLPNYESPGGMFHLQSDLDVSASEMEDNVSIPAQLERVSKEHLYAAYRRTNEKYNKYRGRYTDLARHYRNLERENAKAKAVLVETQDKALRRISELREQCQLEQSAKAHLENALRLELDERNLKIDSLYTKINLLQSYSTNNKEIDSAASKINTEFENESCITKENSSVVNQNQPLVDLTDDQNNVDQTSLNYTAEIQKHLLEIQNSNNKIQKLEQLLVKCKETIKTHKEKNVQLHSEIQIVSNQLDKITKENDELKIKINEVDVLKKELEESKVCIKSLRNEVEELQQIKSSEIEKIELELKTSKEQILSLTNKIETLNKREEENVISLAENKLSIHKELETKESEIKTLNETLTKTELELKSFDIMIKDLKEKLKSNDQEMISMKQHVKELENDKKLSINMEDKIRGYESQVQETENKYMSAIENLKCTEFQLKQESSEKLAVIDRNNFLENRNKQLLDENSNKIKQVTDLEKELTNAKEKLDENTISESKHKEILDEYNGLKINNEELSTAKSVLEDEVNKLKSDITEIRTDNDVIKSDNSKYQSEIEIFKNKIDELEAERKDLDKLRKELEIAKQSNTFESDDLVNKIQSLENEISDITAAFTLEKKALEDLRNESLIKLDAAKVELEEINEKNSSVFNELKLKYDDLLIERDEKISECKSYMDQLEAIEQKYNVLNNDKIEIESKLELLVSENSSLISACEKLEGIKDNSLKQIQVSDQENANMKVKIAEMIGNINILQNELTSLQNAHAEIVVEKNIFEDKILKMEQLKLDNEQEIDSNLSLKIEENENLHKAISEFTTNNENMKIENNNLQENLSKMEEKLKEYEDKLQEYSGNNEVWQMKLSNILNDNNTLQEKCGKLKHEKDFIAEKLVTSEQKCNEFDITRRQLEEAKLEKEFLTMRVSQLEMDLKQTNLEKNKLTTDNNILKNDLTNNTNSAKAKIDKFTHEIEMLKESEQALRSEIKTSSETNNKTKNDMQQIISENNILNSKLQAYNDESKNHEMLIDDKKNMESKLSELTSKIQSLEEEKASEIDKLTSESTALSTSLQAKELEYNELLNKHNNVKSEIDNLNIQVRVLTKIESEHISTIETMQTLKDENNKLLSDIDGLQTHLTKVSRDNSELNDKIREMVANGEVASVAHRSNLESSVDGKEQNVDAVLNKLKDENMHLREQLNITEDLNNKILDLERQNSILVEEKLELEDQVRASIDSNYDQSSDSNSKSEVDNLLGQINAITNAKIELENRLADLNMIQKSNNNNMQILEQKNEKLGLTNEKLERRLDEALVSLNHIRTMEENTELEYLRNILYEYLTGPTNNNLILAKVLAAVVKFDHRQTQLVLEREKEKQGLLGQLGLL